MSVSITGDTRCNCHGTAGAPGCPIHNTPLLFVPIETPPDPTESDAEPDLLAAWEAVEDALEQVHEARDAYEASCRRAERRREREDRTRQMAADVAELD